MNSPRLRAESLFERHKTHIKTFGYKFVGWTDLYRDFQEPCWDNTVSLLTKVAEKVGYRVEDLGWWRGVNLWAISKN